MSEVLTPEQHRDLMVEQLEWHWREHLRPRLDGLSDDEYLWEPAPGAWNVRPRGESTAPVQAGSGEMTIDFAFPEPKPAPVTTIAWRIGHLVVGVFGARNHQHFGGPEADYMTWDYPATADAALAQLDDAFEAWIAGVTALTPEQLAAPSNEAEPYSKLPMATLVLHINREAIHHGAEIALLRDLWAHRT